MRLTTTFFAQCILWCGLFSVAMPTGAMAQDEEQSREAIEEISVKATEAYRAKDYRKALGLFKAAYDLEAVPTLLYNIGRCHERLEEYKEAKTYYELFLLEADPESEIRGKVEDRMKKVELKIQQKELATQKNKKPPEQEKKVEPAKSNVVDYVVLGSGVGLLAAGGVLGFLASSEQSTFEDTSNTLDVRRQAKDSGETFALAADVAFVAGGVVTAVGLWMLLSADEAQPQTSRWAPWVDPSSGDAGVMVHTRF